MLAQGWYQRQVVCELAGVAHQGRCTLVPALRDLTNRTVVLLRDPAPPKYCFPHERHSEVSRVTMSQKLLFYLWMGVEGCEAKGLAASPRWHCLSLSLVK